MSNKTKKKIELPHVYTIAFVLIIVFALLTWIIPSGQFARETIQTAAGERDVAVAGSYPGKEDAAFSSFHTLNNTAY